MPFHLNNRTSELLSTIAEQSDDLKIEQRDIPGGGRLFDFGIDSPGGLRAGLELARVCLADLATVSASTTSLNDRDWPAVQVTTDHPVSACLLSQYAGWQIKTDSFFAMGSGPMRAVAAREELFEKLEYREESERVVGVLETNNRPDASVYEFIAERCDVPPEYVDLLGASVCSIAGNIQVVARSVETALHKLFELGFDVNRIQSSFGVAPLPPVAKDDLAGIGRTNDAILYGGTVSLWVTGDDESLQEIGPQVPSNSSAMHGQPFREVFKAAGNDFYAIDPHLFSPAVVVLHNLETGNVFTYGETNAAVLLDSFGLK